MSVLNRLLSECIRDVKQLADYLNLSPEEIVKHVSFVRRELKKERRREGNRSA